MRELTASELKVVAGGVSYEYWGADGSVGGGGDWDGGAAYDPSPDYSDYCPDPLDGDTRYSASPGDLPHDNLSYTGQAVFPMPLPGACSTSTLVTATLTGGTSGGLTGLATGGPVPAMVGGTIGTIFGMVGSAFGCAWALRYESY